jgi:two-component system, OmpR family, response regulator
MNHRQRLLVVDDSASTTAILAEYLGRIGYRARFASGGPQALAMIREGLETDAVVYDATMPDMGGPAFVRQLRADGKAMPVLLMTAGRGADGEGADAAIAKPFSLVEFGDKLLRMLAAPRATARA